MRNLFIGAIKVYKNNVSPVLVTMFGNACRFTPTCSEYTMEALAKFGTFRGLVLGFKRVSRCHPWGGSGFDPVVSSK